MTSNCFRISCQRLQGERHHATANSVYSRFQGAVHSAFVRTTDLEAQLREVAGRFNVRQGTSAFQCCVRCNGVTAPIPKKAVLDRASLEPEQQTRFDKLVAKRQAETLAPVELQELIQLTDLSEQRDVERLQALSDLARLRGTTVPAVMDALGIRPPAYG